MTDPNEIASRMPRWLRVSLVASAAVFALGAAFYAYRTIAQPVTLTVAAGSVDGESARLISTIASRLAATKSHVRLKVMDTGNVLEAARVFAAGKADLAVVRADLDNLAEARTVLLISYGVVMIVVPSGSSITDMDELKGHTVGVVGGEINHRIVQLLTREYDLARANIKFKDLTPAETPLALHAKQVSALLVVIPLSDHYLSLLRDVLQGKSKSKGKPGVIAIDSAGAIASLAKAYESFDLPKGTLRGSPAIPDDDTTTLRVPFYLVANKTVDEDVIADLTKVIIDARRELVSTSPILAQIASPNTDKDAFIPIHPGAATFFSGDQKSFFDKYGDAFFYGPMLLGLLTSILATGWKFMGLGSGQKQEGPLQPLHALAERIRQAETEAELAAIEDEMDGVLNAELVKCATGDSEAIDAAALSLAAHRLEHLVSRRRDALGRHDAAPSGANGASAAGEMAG